jgi:hypothetical protein
MLFKHVNGKYQLKLKENNENKNNNFDLTHSLI